jgi:hypothetical protein
MRAIQKQEVAANSDSEASTSPSEPPRGPRWLAWLPALMRGGEDGAFRAEVLLKMFRLIATGFVAMAVLLSLRVAMVSQARNAPKEVRGCSPAPPRPARQQHGLQSSYPPARRLQQMFHWHHARARHRRHALTHSTPQAGPWRSRHDRGAAFRVVCCGAWGVLGPAALG